MRLHHARAIGALMTLYAHNPLDAYASVAALASSATCFFTHQVIWLIAQFALT